MTARTISGGAATAAIARLNLARLRRSKAFWIGLALSVLPPAFAVLAARSHLPSTAWSRTLQIFIPLLAIIPPLFTAAAIAEEIEDKTYTYLWSRPIPRWAVVTGKLGAALPVVTGLLGLSLVASFYIATGGSDPSLLVRGLLAAVSGTIAISMASVGLGSLFARQPMATAVAYLLFLDIPIGAIDFSIAKITMTYHVRQLTGAFGSSESIAGALIWMLCLGLAWLGVAVIRVVLAEFSSASK